MSVEHTLWIIYVISVLNQRESNFFQGEEMLISIKTLIICDFTGGSGPPIPPLDPHMSFVATPPPLDNHNIIHTP